MKSLARLGLCAGVLALVTTVAPHRAHAVCSSGGTVSNVNDCVPAGRSPEDCQIEWAISPQPPTDPGTGLPVKKIECLDNDPTCDADTTPGQCTFLVGACVNVTDSRFSCTPTDVASYQIKKPSLKDTLKPHKDRFTRDNRRLLDAGLAAIVPTASANVCTDQQKLVVPLKRGTLPGKTQLYIKSTDTSSAIDKDILVFKCLPNPAIATIPCASARQITSSSELIGGPLAMGKIGDYLIENDKARFIINDTGREFSFLLTFGGHVIDADLQRKLGPTSLSPPYPPGRDAFQAMSPLINISSTDNPTSIMVMNDGASGGPGWIQTTGPDDLMDPIDPRVAILQFSNALSVPTKSVDTDIPVTIANDYTLQCGDDFLTIETTVNNTGGSDLDLYVGDFVNGSGQLETVGPGLGYGDSAIRLGDFAGASQPSFDYLGYVGFGESQFLSYGVIPQVTVGTSSFASSGVTVPVYGNYLIPVLLNKNSGTCQGSPSTSCFVNSDCKPPTTGTDVSPCVGGKPAGFLHVPAGGSNSFKRWFAVGDNGMGRIMDARTRLAARGDIPAISTGFIQGTVTVGGQPVDGARVSVFLPTGGTNVKSTPVGLVDTFETRDGGFYQGTLPKGAYQIAVKVPGHLYEGGGTTPLKKAATIGGGSTIVDFDVPATGFVQVLVNDGVSAQPVASKVSIVGLEAAADPGISQNALLATVHGEMFGYDAREKLVIYGLPQVHFTDLSGDTGVFALQPGDYQIVVSHGPRYSVFKQMLTVVAGSEGSPQVVNATVVPVVDTTGFISSDYHVHMLQSPDSVITNRERIVTMLAEGVDYFAASDHDFITDLSADIAALGAGAAVKTSLSQEITTFDSGHFGAYPFDPLNLPDPNSHTGGALDWGRAGVAPGVGYPSNGSYDLSPDEIGATAKAPPYNAIVFQANHFNSGTLGYLRVHGIDTTVVPPQSSVPPANVRLNPALTNTWTDELTALELWIENSRPQNALAVGENLGDWFNLLNNWSSVPGHELLRKTAVFDSDTHSTTIVQAGGPRTMVADNSGSIAAINPVTAANNLNDGRAIGTNGPFVQVSIVGDGGATAGLALGSPLLVPATLGTATVHVDVQSPDWAEFNQVQLFINSPTSCSFRCVGGSNDGNVCTTDADCPQVGTTTPHCGTNFVGGAKKVCLATPTFTLNKGTDFTVSTVPVNGQNRLEAHVTKTLTGGSLPAGDAWVVAIVKGTDGISKPLFPIAPTSILPKACTGDPCKPCTSDGQCQFLGTCSVSNQTTAELADGNLGQCGVTTLAIANPLFIDRDGDGLYKGLTVP